MIDARIVVEPSTMRPTKGGPVTGSIWIDLGRQQFPENGWNDFVVVVLGWWASAADRLLSGESDQEAVNFMDAPYRVHVTRSSADAWNVVLLDRRGSEEGREVGKEIVSSRSLIESIVRAAELVLAECRRQKWWSQEAQALANRQADLRKGLSSNAPP